MPKNGEKKFNLDGLDGFQNWHAKNSPEKNYSTRHFASGRQKQQIMWRCKVIYFTRKKGVVYVKKNGFFSEIVQLSIMHQWEGCTCLDKKYTSWPPAYSPGLNPTENFWGLIIAKVYEGGRQYSALSELKNAILDVLEKKNVQFNLRN